MNERLLATEVGDWLKESDVPPRDTRASVEAAMARAATTRQVGRPPRMSPHRSASSGPTAAAAAAAFLLVVVTGAAGAWLLTGRSDLAGLGSGASPIGSTREPVHWQTDELDLQAAGFSLTVNDLVFTQRDSLPTARADSRYPGSTSLEVDWVEHGVEQRMVWSFFSDESDWWVGEIRAYDGFEDGQWVLADGPFFTSPLGETFEGDAHIELVGSGRPEDPGNQVHAELALDEMRLSVALPGADGSIGSSVLVDQVLGGIRAIGADLFPQPTREPRTPQPTAPTVGIEAGDLALIVEPLGGGRVRVVDDGAGHRLRRVMSVAVTPDDSVWVATRTAIFALGRPGEIRIGDGDPQGRIKHIEANDDGSLTVYAEGTWRLASGTWTLLEEAPPSGFFHDQAADTVSVSLADGSIWRMPSTYDQSARAGGSGPAALELWTGEDWIPYTLDDIFPGALAQYPAAKLDPGFPRPGSRTDVWVYSRRGLSRFADGAWEEVTPTFLADLVGGPVIVRDVVVDDQGTLWTLLTRDDKEADPAAIQHLLRLADGAWSVIALESPIAGEARSSRFYGLDPLVGGGVSLLEHDDALDYRYGADGLQTVPQLGPHDPVTTSDGARQPHP
jgi:hypothetical protein